MVVCLLASKFYQREKVILGIFNKLLAHLAVQRPDVTPSSMLTTCYCIPQEWETVLHQICSTKPSRNHLASTYVLQDLARIVKKVLFSWILQDSCRILQQGKHFAKFLSRFLTARSGKNPAKFKREKDLFLQFLQGLAKRSCKMVSTRKDHFDLKCKSVIVMVGVTKGNAL